LHDEAEVDFPACYRDPGYAAGQALGPLEMGQSAGKGQSPTNNPKVSHAISGHIVDPGSPKDTAQRIPVSTGTEVTIVVPVLAGTPINTTGGNLSCVLLSVVVLFAKSHFASRDIGPNLVSEKNRQFSREPDSMV
jgi:hypothetical protein